MTPQEQAELIAMVQQILASNSGTPSYGAIAPPMDKYGNPEPWDLSTQGKAFNVVQDWGDIYSDPAILGGMMPDTITPGMLEPSVTYEPLPGQKKLMAAMQNPQSLEGFIAEGVMSDGASATIANIQAILDDPSNPLYPELVGRVPTYNDNGTKAFDMNQVSKIANDFQNAIWDDPSPTLDANGQPVVDPGSGVPAVVKTEETPQAQWFRETGTPLPWDEWSTNDFATPTQQKRRDESFAKTAGAEEGWRDFRSMNPAQPTLAGADREAYINNLMQANMTTPDYPGYTNQTNSALSPGGGGGGGGPDIAGWLDRNIGDPVENFFNGLSIGSGQIGAGEEGGHIPYPALVRQGEATGRIGDLTGYPGFTNPTNATYDNDKSTGFRGDASWASGKGGSRDGKGPARGSRYEAELRLRDEEKRRGPTGREATPQSKKEWDEVRSQRRKNHAQLADEALRKRMIAQLMAQGVTPYTQTMNSRRTQAQQAGFGY